MDAFLADESPQAYQKVVERLLASPAYGEKMALHWLDVGRYADSYGYQDDDRRTQWPWRDWVIHAFNENMPYDQFLLWQLRSEEHTSELQPLMRISYAVFCLTKKPLIVLNVVIHSYNHHK